MIKCWSVEIWRATNQCISTTPQWRRAWRDVLTRRVSDRLEFVNRSCGQKKCKQYNPEMHVMKIHSGETQRANSLDKTPTVSADYSMHHSTLIVQFMQCQCQCAVTALQFMQNCSWYQSVACGTWQARASCQIPLPQDRFFFFKIDFLLLQDKFIKFISSPREIFPK